MTIEKRLKRLLHNSGYINPIKLADSLQGSIWRAINKSMDRTVVIKVTKKNLHQNGIVIINGIRIDVEENIIKETSILKYLTEFNGYQYKKHKRKSLSNCFVKYIDSFQTYVVHKIQSLFHLNLYFVSVSHHKALETDFTLDIRFYS